MCKFISRVSMHQPLVSPPICKQKQSANQSINQSINQSKYFRKKLDCTKHQKLHINTVSYKHSKLYKLC